MLPSHNPDGTQKVTEWYRKQPGHAVGGRRRSPFLYQQYTGHDNNRDWYMFTQVESRLTVAHLYDRWRPQIVHDVHQMGARAARALRAALRRSLGAQRGPRAASPPSTASAPTWRRGSPREGKTGVVVHAHLRRLDARARLPPHPRRRAHPDRGARPRAWPRRSRCSSSELEPGIGYDPRARVLELPRPLAGRDLAPARHRGLPARRQRCALARARRAQPRVLAAHVPRGEPRAAAQRATPYAFVLPAAQKDPLAAAELLAVLRTGAVEVHRARAPFEAGGRTFATGSHVVLMAAAVQRLRRSRCSSASATPTSARTRAGRRSGPTTSPRTPCPCSWAWRWTRSREPFTADLEPVDAARGRAGADREGPRALPRVRPRDGRPGGARAAAAGGGPGALGHGRRSRDGGRALPRGHAARARIRARAALAPLAARAGLVARPVRRAPAVPRCCARRASACTSRGCASMDEGWTRFVFEQQVGVDYRDPARRGRPRGRPARALRRDRAARPGGARRSVAGHRRGALPPEYVGGHRARRAWPPCGRSSRRAARWSPSTPRPRCPSREFGLPVVDVLEPLQRPRPRRVHGPGDHRPRDRSFYCPGAILSVRRRSRPARWATAWRPRRRSGSRAARPSTSPAARVVAALPAREPAAVGLAPRRRAAARKAALVEVPLGRGRVVLFGFRPQYRAQSWATYVPLLNAIYTAAVTDATPR